MKRKFLAALLALVMVFSMIPVSASAAGSFTGDDIDNAKAIEYQSSDVDMLKLLHINNVNVTKDTEIKGVSITFNNGDTQNFLTPTSIDDHVGSFDKTPYFYYTFENVTENNVPSKVTSIAVTYDNGSGETTLTVPADNLLFSNEEKPGRNICAIKSADTSVSVVAFYYEADSNVTLWDLYDIRFVTTGESFEKNNALPAAPVYNENIGNEYKFVNWDYSVNGGNPFLTYTPITGDTVLYAQKVSSEAAGSEYHVMNENNALLGRFIELYNAEYGTTLTINDVEKKSVKISVSGDGVSTDEDRTANRWDTWDGREYYYVYNVGANLIQYHVPFNKAESLTIYAEVNGKEESYTVSINCEEPGAFSITLVQDNIAELIVNPAPQVPSTDDLEKEEDNTILPDGAVTIDCTNEQADHADKTYSLIAGTYTVSESATWVSDGEGSGYYTAEVTIDADQVSQYVTQYDADTRATHDLVDNQGDKAITLIWQNGQWVTADGSAPVTYNVVCDTEPEDETPEKPTWEDVERIFKDAIKVDCVNSNATHNDGTYDALEGSYTLGTVTQSKNLYTVELTFSAEKYLSEYNNLYGNHVLTGEQKNVLTLIYRNDIWCYEGGERYPVIFSVTCEDGGEEPDSNFVTQYWVMNDLDVIEKVFSAKEPDKELAGIELGTSTGIATDGEALGNGWNNSEDKLYYIVSNGEPNGDNYVPWKEVSRLTFLYENGSNGITNLDIRVEEPDENGISKVYLLYDVRYNFNNGTTNGWNHTDSTKNWASASTYTVVTPTSLYLTPPNGDGREVELIGWSQTQHNTIFEPNAELPDHLTAGGTFTVDPNAENTNNTSLMINLYAVWTYKDTSTEPTPDPDPTPDPTPTPGPGGGDKPPYIPPVDPDDSGVSDLLNTDDHIQYLFGYPEGTFGPENNMTRAEVAQMFYNLLLDQDVTITKTFDDVPANAWYAKAVNTLASLGVVSGVGNGDFEPERSITRAEFTSIAMKFAEGKTGGTNIFSDVKSTDWFYRAVVNSTQYGWIHGYGDGTFRPNNPITRVEVTAIVNNMLGREADVDFVTEHYDELNHFSDLVVTHWGYYHIVEATNDHDYTKPSSGENWTELN
ncbi:MAG: S-layer homology domain-containing protein [Acutalibacter sp.]